MGRSIYCHFSFRRPKGSEDGIFAVAFYKDAEGKEFMTKEVTKEKLWQNHQFVTAIQSYENALRVISKLQGYMKAGGITSVYLVSDNSTLVGWIQEPKKNKRYTEYMNRAVEQYRVGSKKEIDIAIGICEARQTEKSYKFCKERYVEQTESANNANKTAVVKKNKQSGINVLDIATSENTYKTIIDLEDMNKSKPEIVGMGEQE